MVLAQSTLVKSFLPLFRHRRLYNDVIAFVEVVVTAANEWVAN